MAVNSCDVKLIQNLLKSGDFNINSIFSWDRYRQISVLQFAILNSCNELIDFLLKNHVELNISTNFLGTALHVAIKQKNLDVVKKLVVSSGADINIMPSHIGIVPPLHRAIQSGTYDITEFLVKSGADVNLIAYKATLTFGLCNGSPLNLAILLINVPMVELLLKHNAIIDQGSNELRSSLQLAVISMFETLKILKILEKFGAKFEIIKDGEYTMEFNETVEQDNLEIFKLFVKKYDNFLDISDLHGSNITIHVFTLGGKNILQYLLDYGTNVNVVDKNNLSMFHKLDDDMYHELDDETLEIIKVIKDHIVKLSAAGLYVNDKNSKAFYIVKNLHKLAVGLRHSDFCFNKEAVLDEFPVYGSIMIEKLRRAVKRKELLNNATELYHIFYKDLPDLVIRNIFNYLNDEDLKLLSQ
ncbi:putative ankyrin repeat protein RF_0381 [Cotesia glomerata]|uniref:putative ankyrin repeat protein RF_0381 n=1 Tax=Cotesia glomerata TaxID=32391 RepID=UPI001D02D7AD|nr:putative ankyrin repeat protein RF_0381 [Cotesia glomerata]